MPTEDEITKRLTKEIAEKLLNNKKNAFPIKVEHKKDVFIGSTCGVHQNKLKLFFQSAEQDNTICLNDKNNEYVFEGSNFFKRYYKSLRDKSILIPLVIFEVKYEKVNTHTVRHYSEVARMIKSIFPFCMYNLLLVNIDIAREQSSDRIYMSAKHFDKVIHKTNYEVNNTVHRILIAEMVSIVSNHLNYLKNEEYFRFNNLI